MAAFDIPDWEALIKGLIDPNDIYDNEEHEFGYELNPHVTVLWGISPEVKFTEVKKYLIPPYKIDIKLSEISMFKSDDYDVIKFSVESKILHTLHDTLMGKVSNKQTFPEYNPHITISYIKSGNGDKYCKLLKTPIELLAFKYDYSTIDGKHKYLYDKNFK
jgi:2'-5' RNA ligase